MKEYSEEESTGEPPPERKSNVSGALIGLAMCICFLVVAFEIGRNSLCGPNGAFGYGGGSNTGAIIVLVSLIVILASAAGAVGCVVWLLVELSRGR